jgi:hypothetical protein
VTPENVVVFLNSLLEIDRRAVSKLFDSYVYCNRGMAEHPRVQVRRLKINKYRPRDVWKVGVLGLINGLFGVHSNRYGPIARVIRDDGIIKSFVLTGGHEKNERL